MTIQVLNHSSSAETSREDVPASYAISTANSEDGPSAMDQAQDTLCTTIGSPAVRIKSLDVVCSITEHEKPYPHGRAVQHGGACSQCSTWLGAA